MAYGQRPGYKRIIVEDREDRHAELLIRLQYDGLNVTEFFRGIITKYLARDDTMLENVEDIKKEKGISKAERNATKKTRTRREEVSKAFGLNQNDIENIFDVLEKDSDL